MLPVEGETDGRVATGVVRSQQGLDLQGSEDFNQLHHCGPLLVGEVKST
jgi:hypothetical protein